MKQWIMVILAICTAFSESEPQVNVDRMPDSDIQDRISSINKINRMESLDSASIQSLESLRIKAIEIAALNHECNSTSINKIPNPRCKQFYLKDLPEFEGEYAKVTGKIYVNRLSLAYGIKDKRNKIDACVQNLELFLNPEFSPQRLAKLVLTSYSTDPIDENSTLLSWKSSKVLDTNLLAKLKHAISEWKQICFDAVTIKNNPGSIDWSPYFISQAQMHFQNTPYFVIGDQIFYRAGWRHSIFINDSLIFSAENPTSKQAHISISAGGIRWEWSGTNLGTKRFKENQITIETKAMLFRQAPEFGKLTDSRDGREYRTVKINGKKWMAENLNFKAKESFMGSVLGNASKSSCYANDTSNCSRYGRLYNLNAAQSACPNGWHLASFDEWSELFQNRPNELASSIGWNNYHGTDNLGFGALPGGAKWGGSKYNDIGEIAYFWSSLSLVGDIAMAFGIGNPGLVGGNNGSHQNSNSELSVRCVESGIK